MRKILGAAMAVLAVCTTGWAGAIAAAPAPAAAAASVADVGAAAPGFTTQGALAGKIQTLKLADQLKKGPVVLYFFPKVFTSGCTLEANEFSEKSAEFKKYGATIIGLSGDKIDEISKFSVEECRNKFTVGRANPAIIKAYGVASASSPERSSRTNFVIGKDGQIKLRHTDKDYRTHVSKTLEAAKALAPAKK